jgi:hypothetical protein
MSKLLVALIAASFATVAGAQAGATKQEKAKTVESTTKAAVAADNPTGKDMAADTAKAKAQKGTPKALPDKGTKQQAVSSVTKADAASTTAQGEAADVAKAKSQKGTPKVAKPDLKDPNVQKGMQKAATQ